MKFKDRVGLKIQSTLQKVFGRLFEFLFGRLIERWIEKSIDRFFEAGKEKKRA